MTEPDLFTEPQAHARTGDRTTSHEAAASVVEITAKQAAVLSCLARFPQGAADVEWIEEYKRLRWASQWPPQTDSGLRTRRSELHEKFKVDAVGWKVVGHRKHTTWKVRA